jgi:hypothetical protein
MVEAMSKMSIFDVKRSRRRICGERFAETFPPEPRISRQRFAMPVTNRQHRPVQVMQENADFYN